MHVNPRRLIRLGRAFPMRVHCPPPATPRHAAGGRAPAPHWEPIPGAVACGAWRPEHAMQAGNGGGGEGGGPNKARAEPGACMPCTVDAGS